MNKEMMRGQERGPAPTEERKRQQSKKEQGWSIGSCTKKDKPEDSLGIFSHIKKKVFVTSDLERLLSKSDLDKRMSTGS